MNNSNNLNKTEITTIPECFANTTRICEINFDCLVTMHDFGFKKYKDTWGYKKEFKTPQWFKANLNITLEEIKMLTQMNLGRELNKCFTN